MIPKWTASYANRLVALTASLGLLGLVFELRFEHRIVLGTRWEPWIGIAITFVAALTGIIAASVWNKSFRRVASIVFLIASTIGLLGVWFHTQGDPIYGVTKVMSAWLITPGRDGGLHRGDAPPFLAPFAISLINIIGFLATFYWQDEKET